MVKVDYFRVLEELSALLVSAVSAACGKGGEASRASLCEIKCECDKKICALEDALFCEFITPIERDNIAALAHCLSRVIDRAIEYHCVAEGSAQRDNAEAHVCVLLSEQLCRDMGLLRHMRRSDRTPALNEFRELLREGREAHATCLARLRAGDCQGYSRRYGQLLISVARVRHELSRCFDELVEVMLNNI